MLSLFKKFRDGLTKTASVLADRTKSLFAGRALDASSLAALEEALYTADFGVATTEEILAEVKRAHEKDKELRGQEAAGIGAAVLRRVLAGSEGRLDGAPTPPSAQHGVGAASPSSARPTVVCLVGVNGSGKTTTAAKLAWHLKQDGRSVLLAACDTFRAAAVEQISIWAQRLDLELVASHPGADAAAVAFDAWQAAKSRGREFLIIDTAGRLHTKGNLMAEL
ncbi:MAG: signal recognition particle-docking protein FtsY, partial [Verrucomicrobia bacterium RIFCSPLOWO2_12_FULL_64_8]